MWLDALKRYLRRRIVYVIIFAALFTYFLMLLLRKGGQDTFDDYTIARREHPLIWRTLQEHVQAQDDNKSSSATNDNHRKCRNTIQGKLLIVDEHGALCARQKLLPSGCCSREDAETKYYTCETCNANQCCTIYEYCVSCCLHPSKRTVLENVLDRTKGRQAMVYAIVQDHFELCLVKCRTNSHSVEHENRYRDPTGKYCYGLTAAHESQVEVLGVGGRR